MNFDMKAIMKQAEEFQQVMAKKQEELKKCVFEASSGGGMVVVKINGGQEIVGVKIDPAIVSAGDVQMLEDLIAAAVNEAMKKVSGAVKKEMGGILGGLKGI